MFAFAIVRGKKTWQNKKHRQIFKLRQKLVGKVGIPFWEQISDIFGNLISEKCFARRYPLGKLKHMCVLPQAARK